ncbi:transposase family protein [Embleya sp. NPDC005575]|uniref:transposase family protein n=1 Tax=Embleya sp. NPDC005575 TaxID=3156892 RepID=UPI0033A04A2D
MQHRVLPIATYWRTNLTLLRVAPLFGVSKSAANQVLDHDSRRSRPRVGCGRTPCRR